MLLSYSLRVLNENHVSSFEVVNKYTNHGRSVSSTENDIDTPLAKA